jgi:hypothetical protein
MCGCKYCRLRFGWLWGSIAKRIARQLSTPRMSPPAHIWSGFPVWSTQNVTLARRLSFHFDPRATRMRWISTTNHNVNDSTTIQLKVVPMYHSAATSRLLPLTRLQPLGSENRPMAVGEPLLQTARELCRRSCSGFRPLLLNRREPKCLRRQ